MRRWSQPALTAKIVSLLDLDLILPLFKSKLTSDTTTNHKWRGYLMTSSVHTCCSWIDLVEDWDSSTHDRLILYRWQMRQVIIKIKETNDHWKQLSSQLLRMTVMLMMMMMMMMMRSQAYHVRISRVAHRRLMMSSSSQAAPAADVSAW